MAAQVTVGAKAPKFTLPRDGGETISLEDFKGRKLVLYFYPKADTSGCTREALDFTKLAPEGNDVIIESRVPASTRDELTARGHEVVLGRDYTQQMGRGQAILRDTNTGINYAASDPRADGAATPEPVE